MILVTGATGNVGRELVPQLVAAGEHVRALVRDPKKGALLGAGVELFVGDLEAKETLLAAMEGARAAYLVGLEARQVERALDAARRAGVELLVRQSTIEAGAVPPLGPGRWHREGELLLEASGLHWAHLRPT